MAREPLKKLGTLSALIKHFAQLRPPYGVPADIKRQVLALDKIDSLTGIRGDNES